MNIITTTTELNSFIKILEEQTSFIAIDTEFKRQSTYYPKLCLIQIATPFIEAIIDPLSKNINLSSFFSLMRNLKILKVFFAARQDIEAIYYLNNNSIPYPIFDCQIAAMLCGFQNNLSFHAIVLDLLKIDIDKSMQRTDWTIRPLNERQIEYALKDATLLREVYFKLIDLLKQENRLNWLEQEFKELTNIKTYEIGAENIWKKCNFACKSKIDFYLLQKLTAWRELQAKTFNLPRLWVFKDDILFDIINQKPQDIFSLKQIFIKKKAKIYNYLNLQEIAHIIHDSIKQDENELIEVPKYNFRVQPKSSLLKKLQELLQKISKEQNIAPSLIATTSDLNKLINNTYKINVLDWRFKIFIEQAVAMIKKEKGLE